MTQRKTISQIIQEAYMDPDLVGGAQVRKGGEGRKYAERRKSPEERKRVKQVGGGKTEPVVQKTRKDAGQERARSQREQQPERERGSAALSPKEQQRKRYLERKAAERGEPQAKTADELLRVKKPEKKVDPNYTPRKSTGLSRQERIARDRKGERALKDIMRGQEREKASKKGEKPSKGEITKRVQARWK